MNPTNNFDEIVNRDHIASLKWNRYKGTDAIPMWVADMDFRCAPAIASTIQNQAAEGLLGYSVAPDNLAETIATRLLQKHGWAIDPSWIVYLPGLVTGLNVSCRAVGDDNDDVATFTPVYPPFLTAPVLSKRTLNAIDLLPGDKDFSFDLDKFADKISPRTKMLLLCNPQNPTGRVYTEKELRAVADICVKNDMVICSDEVHCDLLYDDNKHIATATLSEEIADRTITLMSPSKTFNIAGLNFAFAIISNPKLRKRFKDIANGIVPHPNTLGYIGCETAYSKATQWEDELVEYLQNNRDILYERINKIPSLSMSKTEATYLAWIDISKLDSADPMRLFREAGVIPSFGKEFGDSNYIRLNFGCPKETLLEGIKRIEDAV